jgi:hypothetical protein
MAFYSNYKSVQSALAVRTMGLAFSALAAFALDF